MPLFKNGGEEGRCITDGVCARLDLKAKVGCAGNVGRNRFNRCVGHIYAVIYLFSVGENLKGHAVAAVFKLYGLGGKGGIAHARYVIVDKGRIIVAGNQLDAVGFFASRGRNALARGSCETAYTAAFHGNLTESVALPRVGCFERSPVGINRTEGGGYHNGRRCQPDDFLSGLFLLFHFIAPFGCSESCGSCPHFGFKRIAAPKKSVGSCAINLTHFMYTVNYLFGFFSSFLRKKSKRVFFRKRKTVLSAFFDKTVFVYEFFGRR